MIAVSLSEKDGAAALVNGLKEVELVSDHSDHDGADGDGVDGPEVGATASKKTKKKKKKSKPKSKVASGTVKRRPLSDVPPERPPPLPETPEEAAKWRDFFRRPNKLLLIPQYNTLDEAHRPALEALLTPACRDVILETPRLRLRPVERGDLTGIRRIKMEPVVQKTQLYGAPSLAHMKDVFLQRYIVSSIPRIKVSEKGTCRGEYIFAITAKDPSAITIQPNADLRLANRLTSAEGYLGNIAIQLNTNLTDLLPQAGAVARHPTSEQCAQAGLHATMFYEIHPQLWGQGLMTEGFTEVLRFAMEEVGCTKVMSDPTSGNDASIKLCTSGGMRFVKEEMHFYYKKPQLIHEITRDEWFALNRPEQQPSKDHWGGKEVCRWCLNFRLAPPTIKCDGCDFAHYCSRECQKADWLWASKSHQKECQHSKLR